MPKLFSRLDNESESIRDDRILILLKRLVREAESHRGFVTLFHQQPEVSRLKQIQNWTNTVLFQHH